jgi:Xaa-Pro aminopeptidase
VTRRFIVPLLAIALAAAPIAAQIASSEYAARRSAVLDRLGDGIVVALGSPEPVHDYESFNQNPDFLYLTGVREPNAALILVKRGDARTSMLFVEPRDPATEVWSGARLGATAASTLTGVPARDADALEAALDSLLKLGLPIRVAGDFGGENEAAQTPHKLWVQALRAKYPQARVETAARALMPMRGKKSAAELDLIRKAAQVTVAAHREAARALEPGQNEFEIQALIEYTFRRNGADRPSFATIVGSGPNSTTLHYNADDRFMQAGEVVVMDIGASYKGYAADVTRTYPVSGTFTPAQREIYQIVRDAQAAAERNAKPGMSARVMSDSAATTIARGLARLGLIESPTATYDCGDRQQCAQYELYYMHGLGHGIGLEVHDPDQFYFTGTIAEGSAFTIEPGIYVRAGLLEIIPDTPRNRQLREKIAAAVRKYANIGIRIEDDYVVTAQGLEWISKAPRELAEVEALMQQPFAGPAPRDPAMVEAYRSGTR